MLRVIKMITRRFLTYRGESQLNVIADTFATNFLGEGIITPYEAFPANPANLYVNNNIITRKLQKVLRNASRSLDLRLKLIIKYHWTDYVPDTIWWSIHGSTMKSFCKVDQRHIRKFIFGWLPTCVRLKQYNDEIDTKCPSCKISVDTHYHIIRCN